MCSSDLHKNDYSTARAEAEAKYQQMEEALAAARVNGPNASNTVKARRFGRSVVNLLRQKSNHSLQNGDHSHGNGNGKKSPSLLPNIPDHASLYSERSGKDNRLYENASVLLGVG